MKKQLHLRIMAVAMLLLLFACREESTAISEFESDNSLSSPIKKISYRDMLVKLPIGTLNDEMKFSKPAINGKSIEEFDIDTTIVNQIQFEGNPASYTMKIIPKSGENPDELYNLNITTLDENVTYEIIKYSLENGKLIADENHTQLEYSTTNRQPCITVVIACEYGHFHDDDHCEGSGQTTYTSCSTGNNSPTGGGGSGPGGGTTTPTGGGSGSGGVYTFDYYKLLKWGEWQWLDQHIDIAIGFAEYLSNNQFSTSANDFVKWGATFFVQNPGTTWEQFINSKHDGEPNSSIDIQNNISGNYDETSYGNFDFENPQTQWPTVNSVIPVSDFVGWNAPGINKNCMDYAKAQIAKKGYKISNYYDVDSKGEKQTFQIYTEQNGVNLNDLYKGVSYIKYALSKGIPVIVGVDDDPGSPGNLDNSTDHFVVIVGMGVDSKGQFFRFFDNASGNDPQNQGANPENKFYYNYSQKIFTGKTFCSGYRNTVAHDYIITMIRKSK